MFPKRQNPGDRMTQSHLPRTGRGVVEAAIECCIFAILELNLPFRKKKQVFYFVVCNNTLLIGCDCIV